MARIQVESILRSTDPIAVRVLREHALETGLLIYPDRVVDPRAATEEEASSEEALLLDSLPQYQREVFKLLRKGRATGPVLAEALYGDRSEANSAEKRVRALRKRLDAAGFREEIANDRDGRGYYLRPRTSDS